MSTLNVTLRPFQENDLDTLLKMANNPLIAANLRDSFPHPYTEADAKNFLAQAISAVPTNRFAILENGVYVGNIGIHLQDDVYRNTAELGYFIGEPYWGRGIATEAVKLIITYGFETLELHRIFAGVFSYNPASARVLEKAGLEFEGVHRKAITKKGGIYDELYYAILNPSLL